MDENLHTALAKFREPTKTLGNPLSNVSNTGCTGDLVKPTQVNYNRYLTLLFIRNHGSRILKRCTPCQRCHSIKTYGVYCTRCDAEMWMEIG